MMYEEVKLLERNIYHAESAAKCYAKQNEPGAYTRRTRL